MGLARAHAIALVGVQGHAVEIEADIENGMVALLLVGLPDTALREARDRIRSAIVNSGESWPTRRITVGLSPASLPKRGSGFDLGIAMAILAAAGAVPAAALRGLVLIGELGLDGRVRPVPGVLPAAAAAAAAGFDAVAVATENAAEAALVPDLQVIAVPSLSAFTAFIRNGTGARARTRHRGHLRRRPPRGIRGPGCARGGPRRRGRARRLRGHGQADHRRPLRNAHQRQRPGRPGRPAGRQASRRDLRGWRPSPDAARATGLREDHARGTYPNRAAAA